jgi:hypothetical protein
MDELKRTDRQARLPRERQSAGAVKTRGPGNGLGPAFRSDRIAVLTGCGLRIGRDWQARSPPATTMRRSPPQVRGFRARGASALRADVLVGRARQEKLLMPSLGLLDLQVRLLRYRLSGVRTA